MKILIKSMKYLYRRSLLLGTIRLLSIHYHAYIWQFLYKSDLFTEQDAIYFFRSNNEKNYMDNI